MAQISINASAPIYSCKARGRPLFPVLDHRLWLTERLSESLSNCFTALPFEAFEINLDIALFVDSHDDFFRHYFFSCIAHFGQSQTFSFSISSIVFWE